MDLNKAEKQSRERGEHVVAETLTPGARQTEGVPAFAPRLQTFSAQLAG